MVKLTLTANKKLLKKDDQGCTLVAKIVDDDGNPLSGKKVNIVKGYKLLNPEPFNVTNALGLVSCFYHKIDGAGMIVAEYEDLMDSVIIMIYNAK